MSPTQALDVHAEQEPSSLDQAVLRLFCVWVFCQCFFWQAVPLFRWSLGIGFIVSPDRLALVVLLLAVVRHMISVKKSPIIVPAANRLGLFAVLFTSVALGSWLIYAPDRYNTSFGTLTWIMNLSVYPTVAFYIATRLRFNRQMLDRLVWFFGLVGVYLSITALAEHFSIDFLVFPKYILDPTVGTHFGRSRGPFVDTISNGGMLVIGFGALCYLTASLTGVRRAAALLCALLVVPAVYFTETRGVWLGWAAVAATFLLLRTSLRRAAVPVAAVLLVGFVLGIGSKFSLQDATLFSRRQQTVDYRLDNYKIAWDTFKANPLTGVGYGMFFSGWRDYADLNNSRTGLGVTDGNHSTWLGILAELGLVGALPFIALVGCAGLVCLIGYWHLRRGSAEYEIRFAVVTVGVLQSYFILSLTNDLKAMPGLNVATFFFVGVLGNIVSARLSSPSTKSGKVDSPVKAVTSTRAVAAQPLRSRASR